MTLQVKSVSSFRFDELFHDYINQFHENLYHVIPDVKSGSTLPLQLVRNSPVKKYNPIIQAASPDHAQEIVNIYRDIYGNTYPYKEMTDVEEVRRMLKNKDYTFILFKDKNDIIMGCFTFVFDFVHRRAYMRGYNVKRKYQKYFDVVKGFIGSLLAMIHEHQDRILMWYAENRTAHSASQYFCQVAGVKNVAFLPNKDIFLNKIESDMMHVGYHETMLKTLRSSRFFCILPEVVPCFTFISQRYSFLAHSINVVNPDLFLDHIRVHENVHRITRCMKMDAFGHVTFTFKIRGSDSFLKGLYTSTIKNMEKIKYHAESLEELSAFLIHLQHLRESLGVRYVECMVSAREPLHQRIFLNHGFYPRGYMPSWEFDEDEKKFYDCILFNWFLPPLAPDLKLIDEGWMLLRYLNFIN